MLAWKLTASGGYISIDTLRLLIRKRWKVIPISLKRISDIVCSLWITEFQDGVVVEGPILGIFVFTPDLLAFDSKDLHADSSWSGNVIWKKFGCQGGISHDHVVAARLSEHALCEMWRQVLVDNELSHNAALSLQVGSTETVVVLIEVHHLEAIELFRNLPDLVLLSIRDSLDTFSIP